MAPSILVATGFVRIDADTKPAMKALKALGSIGGNLLATAIGPAGAAVATALGAVSSSAAAAGGAVAIYGAAVKQQFSQVQEAMQKQKTAQDAQTKATNATAVAQQLAREGGFKYGQQVKITADMTEAARARAQNYNSALSQATSATKAAKLSQEAYKTQLGQMPKATSTLTEALQKLKDDTKAWSDSMAGSTMPVFTRGIQFLDGLLPKLSPIVRGVAHEIDGFVTTLGQGVAGKVFREFGNNVSKNGAGALRTFLDIARNITVGLVGLLNAFTPFSKGVTGGLESMTQKFAVWGATVGKSKGFASFTNLAKETGPKLVHLLAVLGDAFIKVASAAGPMSGIGLTLLTVFANIVDAIPTPVLQLLVPTILAVNTAMKLYAIYTSIATGVTWLFTTAVTTSTGVTYASRLALFLSTAALWIFRAAMIASAAATWIMTAATTAWGIAVAVATSPITLIILALVALGVGIYLLVTKTKFFQTIWKGLWDFMKMVGAWFAGPFVDFFTKTIPGAFKVVIDWVKAKWPWLLGGLAGPIGLAVVAIIKHWDSVKAGLKAGWDFIYKWVVKPWVDMFTKTIPAAAKYLRDKAVGWLGNLRDGLKVIWDWIYKHLVQPNVIAWTQTIPGAAKTLWNRVVSFFGGMRDGIAGVWNGIKSRVINPIQTFFTKSIPGWASTMSDRVKGFFRSMRDGIGTIWDGVKNKAKSPINWVIDHVWNHGIRSIWGKIAGWIGIKNTLGSIKLLASGGTVGGRSPMGLFRRPTAIVGEGNPMYPEYVIPTDPRYKRRAQGLWQAAGVHFMKDGGILGSIGSWLGSAASTVGNVVTGAIDFLTDPVGNAKKLLNKALGGMGAIGTSPWAKAIATLPHKAVDGLIESIKKAGSSLLGAIGLGSSGGSGVKRWSSVVQMALRMVGQVPALLGITLKRMNQESGGNPNIVNRWDSNWKAGHPSVGLMQVIGPTFRAYAGKMRNTGPFLYGVSVNPLANVYASMRYALAAYGSLAAAYGRKGGYRNGTTSAAGGWHLFGENGPEMGYSPAGWRILNAQRTAGGVGGGLAVNHLVLENHGVIGSQQELENWLVDSLTTIKRKGRTP